MASVASRKLFVSNLSWITCRNSLRDYFSQFGKVNGVNVVFDKKTGFSKNYGFVVMGNEKGVQSVLDSKSHNLEGRKIVVAPHTTQEDI